MMAQAEDEISDDSVRWFSPDGCVEYHEEHTDVFVGGTLVGSYGRREEITRNLLLVNLAKESRIKKGRLAWAFSLSVEQVRQIRRRVEAAGVQALFNRPGRGRPPKVTSEIRKNIFAMFDAGHQIRDVWAVVSKSPKRWGGISRWTVCDLRTEWLAAQAQQPSSDDPLAGEEVQLELAEVAQPAAAASASQDTAARSVEPAEEEPAGSGGQDEGGDPRVQALPLRGGTNVQHVGGWLLLSMVSALGLHTAVQQGWQATGRWGQRLRMALDAVVLALGLGQRCVEGVRRLRTSSAGVLLRSEGAPTASWTRRIVRHYLTADGASEVGDSPNPGRGHAAQMRMMELYLARARRAADAPAVFYVDNHMRAYTGKYTLRKGWRMQDKRAKPGASDYYVHDEDGRPVFRYTAPEHDSLCRWLSPVTQTLREALGSQQRILLAFDRAGAFPESMATLRDRGFEFVTYERRPYPTLPKTWFTKQLVIGDDDGGDGEVIGVHERRRKNLGKGRGRVRRISLLMADGYQINLLAISAEPVARLVEVMLGRWVQENAFKHGNERWGINQLDSRKKESYPPDTIVPNPLRTRLDRAMRLARAQEGRARSKLARLDADDPRRDKHEKELDEALLDQKLYRVFRAIAPVKAPLKDTELAGKLVKHDPDYKALIDTIRIACANAESDLALMLAPRLKRPQEAKKALANLFAAPGSVRVNAKSLSVTLRPAGTPNEWQAFSALFDQVNRLGLSLPGDHEARKLHFRVQL